MFFSMSILFMEIGNQIHGLQFGYTPYQVDRLGCPDNPDARWCPIYEPRVILPIALSILGIMFYFMYIFVTDILLSRKQRIEKQ